MQAVFAHVDSILLTDIARFTIRVIYAAGHGYILLKLVHPFMMLSFLVKLLSDSSAARAPLPARLQVQTVLS